MTLFALGDNAPEIHPDTWAAHDANLIGKVVLEEGASVWFGVTIRADHEEIRVGRGSNVQENCVFHVDAGFPLSIGENCTIGHKVMLHGCTIGNRILIGMAAVIMDGAVVQDEVIIAAGTLVPPGKVLESGYLYKGSPVRKDRPLTEKEMTFFHYTAKRYVDLAARYLDEPG